MPSSKIVIAAIPYDSSASFFYFSSGEEWDRKSKSNRNDFGQVVEEYSFDFIDGPAKAQRLLKIMGDVALMTGEFFDAVDEINDDDVELLEALQGIGFTPEAGEFGGLDEVEMVEDVIQEANDRGYYIFDGNLEDFLREEVDQMGGLKELDEDTLSYHFDFESYAQDRRGYGGFYELGPNTLLIGGE